MDVPLQMNNLQKDYKRIFSQNIQQRQKNRVILNLSHQPDGDGSRVMFKREYDINDSNNSTNSNDDHQRENVKKMPLYQYQHTRQHNSLRPDNSSSKTNTDSKLSISSKRKIEDIFERKAENSVKTDVKIDVKHSVEISSEKAPIIRSFADTHQCFKLNMQRRINSIKGAKEWIGNIDRFTDHITKHEQIRELLLSVYVDYRGLCVLPGWPSDSDVEDFQYESCNTVGAPVVRSKILDLYASRYSDECCDLCDLFSLDNISPVKYTCKGKRGLVGLLVLFSDAQLVDAYKAHVTNSSRE
ncbi:hypothetical protein YASMINEVIRUS_145 [Yasminevirus sp. GU-2018]|uniref:Uncharacterized protein n=1 Tax=Yasminevirus sp. GU-2018 TaxID=2420051 RepID=A0A5K0U8F8_9VIRU|nr:hypothetical protein YASMINEVIRUS_145 [Yasminevirus sp. GU-2018]